MYKAVGKVESSSHGPFLLKRVPRTRLLGQCFCAIWPWCRVVVVNGRTSQAHTVIPTELFTRAFSRHKSETIQASRTRDKADVGASSGISSPGQDGKRA